MAEPLGLPSLSRREELRRSCAALRVGGCQVGMTAGVAALLAALAGSLLWPPRLALIWNGSASSPIGLYLVSASDEVVAGQAVAAWAPDAARQLAAERRYLPYNLPLVKNVAASWGDRVCAVRAKLYVNGRLVASRQKLDRQHRAMPWWTGCRQLAKGELFLLNPAVPEAFDGRYFGVTQPGAVIGRASLLWAG
jgi:conjugative transfer signal peptidase TraF